MNEIGLQNSSGMNKEEKENDIEDFVTELKMQITNYSKSIRGNKKDVSFSPLTMRIALCQFMSSPSGSEQFKSSSLQIYPSTSLLKKMKATLTVTEGLCPAIYANFYDDFVSKQPKKIQQTCLCVMT